MPRKQHDDAAPTLVLDPSSAAVVLTYVGDGREAGDAPARDLSANDLARLVFVRSTATVHSDTYPDADGVATGIRPDPMNPDPETAAALVAELVATGLYSTDLPAAPATDLPQEG